MKRALIIALASAFSLQAAAAPELTLATNTQSFGQSLARDPRQMRHLDYTTKLALLRRHIKYVFVLFQENRSFDHYFGTYPGANGLFSSFPGADSKNPDQQAARDAADFHQTIWNMDGSFASITPFLAPRSLINKSGQTVELYPEDFGDVDHNHNGMVNDMHFDKATRSHAKNDAYAIVNEQLAYGSDSSATTSIVTKSGAPVTTKPTLAQHQTGELVLAHVDCDTIPFLWQYADRFTLFDNFHQTTIGPSTPNAIAMIAGQTGETQWALHPQTTGKHMQGGQMVPVINDDFPYPGSAQDKSPGPKPAYGANIPPEYRGTGARAGWSPKTQAVLTFASLPLSFMGPAISELTKKDENPQVDLADIQDDIKQIAKANKQTAWGWYQQGYGREPFDGAVADHSSYILHHNGPQYFGYLGDNPTQIAHMHGLADFYADIAAHRLPAQGGVFYVRGGYANNDKLQPLDPSPHVRAIYAGNDDHPGYSDSQISEALVADSVNAIASSPYWPNSAIIITYDETDGFYDHAPIHVRSWGPDGLPLTGGPRIPTIIISPYAAAHTVAHTYSEHSSVIKFIDALFHLTKLADLPDEKKGRESGRTNPTHDPALRAPSGAPQANLVPADDGVPMGDLFEAFDNDRLLGRAPPLPAALATIANPAQLPHPGCAALHITPTDYPHGYKTGGESDPPPADFNPRPKASPGVPAEVGWKP